MSNNENDWETVVTKKKVNVKNEPVVTSHQNWDPVVIHGKNAKPVSGQKKVPVINNNPEIAKLRKLDGDEIVKLKSLSNESRQELIQMRVAKGYNQEKLAQALAMPVNLYKDIENGKTTPQHNVLMKINNFLGTKVKLT